MCQSHGPRRQKAQDARTNPGSSKRDSIAQEDSDEPLGKGEKL